MSLAANGNVLSLFVGSLHAATSLKKDCPALGLYNALQLYPSTAVPCPVPCRKARHCGGCWRISFRPDLSPSGSNSRAKEGRTLGFWADYLLDCQGLQKESAKITLFKARLLYQVEEVLMFATGLNSLPPSGLIPQPKLEFIEDSPYPMANTCANTMKLPQLDNFELFRVQYGFWDSERSWFRLATKTNLCCICCTPIYLHKMIRSGPVNHVLFTVNF
ncbi:G2/M phase-specific E3 ubiquitin-protein ligase [Merluccius polli]|uniref:G2/M phase-specific E3 ubiquitin-protein ligase n=1 Tax=Merluccius polli TaxID=89951 RepID=A0AA47NYJ8_MERPO|nr:G2/M phase-specific E3 ubiquitin-protein ligase [Merluccius polli]